MSTVIGDISVSIDGYVTGPDPGPLAGLGTDGVGRHSLRQREVRVSDVGPATFSRGRGETTEGSRTCEA